MRTLHLYSNYHIKHQVGNIRKGDWILLEDELSRKRWSAFFRYNKINEADLNLTFITKDEFFNLSNLTFNIVGNPPYNSDDTSRNDKAHRGQGDNLAKKFVLKSFELLGDDGKMVIVMPYGHRTYSPRLAETYRKNGLYKIDDVRHEFKQVATNPCAFYFDKSKVVDVVEDNYKQHTRQIPERNIGQIFRNQPGRLNREDYEAELTEEGKYRIVVTTGIQKYTNDKTIVDRMNDKTRGSWRVVMNCTTQKGKWGKMLVEGPDSVLSKSVHCLVCQSEEEANKLKAHLETDEVLSILEEVKLNSCNSKKYLEYIPL
jgi:hypothetical protein